MSVEKSIKKRICYILFGWVFALLALFAPITASTPVFAEPETTETTETSQPETTTSTLISDFNGDVCKQNLGAVGWLVCPAMNVVSSATDSLYTVIKDLLVIKPFESNNNSPVYIIWKYCLSISNLVFIIFLLVVVFSQITGLGINNYGIKKILPKLIVSAILINISFLICELAVEVSNIVGASLRSIFESVPITVGDLPVSQIPMQDVIGTVMGTAAIAGITVVASSASLWMLIPTILAGLAAVVSGLITIALRQTVVTLLVMISPLAFVCSMLPNTKDLFLKWKNLFKKMLVFYPLFSLLFGASNLAGWAIIANASNNPDTGMFMVILGLGVQIMPLFFSWSLMKMSGTFLGDINAKIRSLADRPIATNRAWAESRRDLAKAKRLSSKTYMPSARLAQYLSDRKIAREAETAEHKEFVKNRGLYYGAGLHYRHDKNGKILRDKNGHEVLNEDGMDAYEMQAKNMEFKRGVLRDKNNFNKGFDKIELDNVNVKAQNARIDKLNDMNIKASDALKFEASRGVTIEKANAEGFYTRTQDAINAHMDELYGDKIPGYRMHDLTDRSLALKRYQEMLNTMDGSAVNAQYAAAEAAHAYNAQDQIMQGKFQKYFELAAPTRDVVGRLYELTSRKDSSEHIDAIIAGLRVLNARGDTDLVREAIDSVCSDDKLKLGTYASQSLASFLMFEVKDNSPYLRRFGKYINLETAAIYNDKPDETKRRHKQSVDLEEYLTGVVNDPVDVANNYKPKRDAIVLVNGTSFKGVERLAFKDIDDSIIEACIDKKTGKIDIDKYTKYQKNIWDSILANLVGDQFSYLSGSEQILALAQFVTGLKFKGKDANGELIYVDATPFADMDLSEEDRKKVNDFYAKRTDEFVNAQVTNQIARTKTDMLYAVMARYKDDVNKEIEEENLTFNSEEDRQEFCDKRSKELFRNAMKPSTLGGLAKTMVKGFQGDTKENLIKATGFDDPEILRKALENAPGQNLNKKSRRATEEEDDEEDDIAPVVSGDAPASSNPYIPNLDSLAQSYGDNVEGFHEEVTRQLEKGMTDINEIDNLHKVMDEVNAKSFTNAASMWEHIKTKLNLH